MKTAMWALPLFLLLLQRYKRNYRMLQERYIRFAQDVSRVAGTGAYTGEVSAELLKDSQINFVLVGHSERRDILVTTLKF